ncbi:MAG: PDZ domain-containing protein [Actinobacteria bacterium]|nr:PDZ domain-containing protein [Actinomycetota bacterium]
MTSERPDTPPIPAAPSTAWDVPVKSRRRRVVNRVLGTVTAIVLVAAIAGVFIRLPYVIISPGSATPVNRVVKVSGAPTYSHRGSLLFLTVSVTNGRPNVYRTLVGWLSSDQDVQPEKNELGCLSRAENDKQNVMLMTDSQQVAKTVALSRLGYHVGAQSTGVMVFDVAPGTPACGKLLVGDHILSVDGAPVAKAADIGPLVRAHPPGRPVTFTVLRDNVRREVTVVTTKAPSSPYKGMALVGITPSDEVNYSFPQTLKVSIDAGPVTGPSAGLAFTLTLLDELTPGGLTGGRNVAVTGAIALDGSVGDVGGVAQKAVTARHAGAKLFIVPVGEETVARAHAGSMKVVAVRTLDDALRALHDAGGASLPPPPSTTTLPSVAVP